VQANPCRRTTVKSNLAKQLWRLAPALLLALLGPALAFAADAPTPNKGDTSWMLMSTDLVILMTIPGLALFYGGMVRSKNVLSVSMQIFIAFSLMALLWAVYGYSIAFTEGNDFFGGFSKIFLKGVTADPTAT